MSLKAVILSAGQGRRLLPLTADIPKCALQLQGRAFIEWQINELRKCGIDQVTAILGFEAEKVERLLARQYDPQQVRTLYNPFFGIADNLVSCWVARGEMTEDFLLLNGDTLFETTILKGLLDTPARPVTLVIDRKLTYDADDMKVTVDGDRLVRVGKDLSPEQTNGESIGMMLFRANGPALFCEAVEHAIRRQQALKQWYLSVIDEMAGSGLVWTHSIEDLQWVEVDCRADLDQAEKLLAGWNAETERVVGAGPL